MIASLNRRSLLSGLVMASGSAILAGSAGPLLGAARRGGGTRKFFERTGKSIGLQLYTLGDEPGKDLDGVFAKLAQIGYRDLELPNLLGRKPDELRAAADKAGVSFSSVHLAASNRALPSSLLLNSDKQFIADTLGTLGIHQAVVPMVPLPEKMDRQAGDTFQTMIARAMAAAGADIWKTTAAMLNERASALKPYGITLGYHNHNIEFAPIGQTTGWEILAAETDPSLVKFEVDLGWIAAAGLDPVAFLKQHSGRVQWIHVKDVKPATVTNFALNMVPAEVGAGKLDWARILPTALAAGVQHFYVEQEPPFAIPRMESVAKSYAYLAALRA